MQYEEFRKACHYLVDYIAGYLQNVEDKPLFPDGAPSVLYELFDESLPDKLLFLEEWIVVNRCIRLKYTIWNTKHFFKILFS